MCSPQGGHVGRPPQTPEALDPVERQVVRVVVVVGPSQPVVAGRAQDRGDVVPVERPVRILPRVIERVRVPQDHRPYIPVSQVWGTDERECVPGLRRRPVGRVRHVVRQRPVLPRRFVPPDRELLRAAREVDQACVGVEARLAAVVAHMNHGGDLGVVRLMHAQYVDHLSRGRHHGVALEPAAEFAAKP